MFSIKSQNYAEEYMTRELKLLSVAKIIETTGVHRCLLRKPLGKLLLGDPVDGKWHQDEFLEIQV
jgi:hypothetical protein